MQIIRKQLTPTTIKLTIEADQALLAEVKVEVLQRLGRQMKIPGFRPGKAPAAIVEKQADSSVLQSEVLDAVLNKLYSQALEQEKIRPVDQPKVTIQKFVPFTTLSFDAEVTAIGEITIPDYKKLRLARKPVHVSDKEVEEVVSNLRQRLAEKRDVDRAAKNGDEVVIDFTGSDATTHEAVKGADGTEYPLTLGSDTFIPGFEANLVGLKPGGERTFTITFPKDYGVHALQNRKVTFKVTVAKVREISLPDTDDAFAAKVGPFKSMEKLREDIHKQMQAEKDTQADRDYRNELLEKLGAGTVVAIPDVLIDEEVERTEQQARQNLNYRGQTWQEFLDEAGKTEVEHRKTLREPSELRVKIGLMLTEVAMQENLTVTPEELRVRLQLLKGQYTDKAMQAELEKPENVRSILSGMLSEKTIAKLSEYAQAA